MEAGSVCYSFCVKSENMVVGQYVSLFLASIKASLLLTSFHQIEPGCMQWLYMDYCVIRVISAAGM